MEVERFYLMHSRVWFFRVVALAFAVYLVLGMHWHHAPVFGWFPDPYPYPFLTNYVSLWAILLAIAEMIRIGRIEQTEREVILRAITDLRAEVGRGAMSNEQ